METKNSYLSFQEWRKDFFEVEKKKENRNILIEYGVINDLTDNLHCDTKIIRIYKKGGHLEILENGLFSVGLDRTTYQDKKLEPIEKELYNWCNGELFNLYDGWASVTNNIANRIMRECEKDSDYLFEIVHEYLQLLENTELGLKGIKETLEERGELKQ
tara:strand:- start:436 stop:912 length:477 start_codon:yes stop_codon:yes gene_type:complete